MTTVSPAISAPAEKFLDDDFIERNLKELQEKKSREERKANGRLAAVIVALLLVFLAMYHAWIRNTGALAGAIVPALIMILYGGWVVTLAKRDKKNRQMYEKHLEEAARKHLLAKIELGRKKRKKSGNGTGKQNDDSKKKSKKSSTTIKNNNLPTNQVENEKEDDNGNCVKDVRNTIKFKIENHKTPCKLETSIEQTKQTSLDPTMKEIKIHKQHRNKNKKSPVSSNSSHATKDIRNKRPSFRQKLFRQNATELSIFTNKKLKRMDALAAPPPLSRTSSAP